jgi:hypothetical protein
MCGTIYFRLTPMTLPNLRLGRTDKTTLIRPNSDKLFYVYTGAAARLLVDPLLFLRTTRLLQHNLVIFRDSQLAFYQRGLLPDLGTFEACLQWQRTFTTQLSHVRRVFCIGTSMGAYAALLFGHLLSAEEVWSFAPSTTLTGKPNLQGAVISAERRDLALLLDNSNHRTVYNVYFNHSCRPDRSAAERLVKCPNVRLWPQLGKTHNVVAKLLKDGRLQSLFSSLANE